jgi:hypothetical protein
LASDRLWWIKGIIKVSLKTRSICQMFWHEMAFGSPSMQSRNNARAALLIGRYWWHTSGEHFSVVSLIYSD